jgi:hypothetical protein
MVREFTLLGLVLSRSLQCHTLTSMHRLRTILFGRLDYWRNVRNGPPSPDARALLSRSVDRAVCREKRVPCFHDVCTVLPTWRTRLENLFESQPLAFADNSGSSLIGIRQSSREGLISLEYVSIHYFILCGKSYARSISSGIFVCSTHSVPFLKAP